MKQYSKVMCVIGTIFFVVGIVVLLSAVNLGMDAANIAIQKNGGSMETERFYYIMQSTANTYMIGGSIVSVIGGLASIVFGYQLVKEK
uniref:hypothetical protein n=1 Tax=Acetatifactor sp. TaxID=1872090 RepID=UPI004056FCCE